MKIQRTYFTRPEPYGIRKRNIASEIKKKWAKCWGNLSNSSHFEQRNGNSSVFLLPRRFLKTAQFIIKFSVKILTLKIMVLNIPVFSKFSSRELLIYCQLFKCDKSQILKNVELQSINTIILPPSSVCPDIGEQTLARNHALGIHDYGLIWEKFLN